MDILRRLPGATTDGPLSKEEDGQNRSLLAEEGGVASDSDEGSRIITPHKHRSRWPAMCWMLSSVILGLYSVLLTLYVTKKPSDLACAKQLSMYCRWDTKLDPADSALMMGFYQRH